VVGKQGRSTAQTKGRWESTTGGVTHSKTVREYGVKFGDRQLTPKRHFNIKQRGKAVKRRVWALSVDTGKSLVPTKMQSNNEP